jgi:hypothetical protein
VRVHYGREKTVLGIKIVFPDHEKRSQYHPLFFLVDKYSERCLKSDLILVRKKSSSKKKQQQ